MSTPPPSGSFAVTESFVYGPLLSLHGYVSPREWHSLGLFLYSQLPEAPFACVALGVEQKYVVPCALVHSLRRVEAVPRVTPSRQRQYASDVYADGDALPFTSIVGQRLHHDVGLHETDTTVALR